jgi:hypothetical protein
MAFLAEIVRYSSLLAPRGRGTIGLVDRSKVPSSTQRPVATRRHRKALRLAPGAVLQPQLLVTISGSSVDLPATDCVSHLQFRRFIGCPICNLHLHSVVQRHDEIVGAGIREVVVFHSTTEELLEFQTVFPFDVVADPDRRLYRQFGVERSLRAVLDPRSWWPTLRGLLRRHRLREDRPDLPLHPHGGRLGLPADFLIAPDGAVLARKYGNHAFDQWSVDDLLRLVSER